MNKVRTPGSPGEPAPSISFREEPAGRETLEAIAQDRPVVEPRSTKHYGDRISNAPGAVSPRIARALDTHPEIAVTLEVAGRATFAAIERELAADGPTIEINGPRDPQPSVFEFPIERMCTFVVKAPMAALESPIAQSDLVRERLLPFLPVNDARHVTRVEVRPWHDAESLLVRVWCRVP